VKAHLYIAPLKMYIDYKAEVKKISGAASNARIEAAPGTLVI
jgi:hypothetical protein